MEKRTLQKLNKAAVATVLAASGVTITAPIVPVKADTIFADLDPKAEHYEPVLSLYNRGFIQGYEDGTFRPNNKVTRGQAAKMLAQALDLNIKSPKDPGFSDVQKSNSYYKYIAALANAGIVNGYVDGTYRPNEPINRNQMAKILTLGYQFNQSTKLTHQFHDVTESNLNKYYIQTLYDLGVTKGKTPVTFAPFELVTRGQLASFIMRAENVSGSSKVVKEIGEVTDSYVYINGSKHLISSSLRNIFNASNAAVLKGAQIEGEVSDNMLRSVKKITINAEGTKNRVLIFNGQGSIFGGELIIQGNYLRFEDWELTGQVTISEAAPRTLSQFNPLSNTRLASLNTVGFIDWTKPGNIEDPIKENEELIDPNKEREAERMPVVKKYIDFSNCTLRRVTIDADRTSLAADWEIEQLTVRGNVHQYELYANVGTLYLETDYNTTMYGISDIVDFYKNNRRNLNIFSNSYIGRLIIDSTHGWTNIGENTYIDTVVIPTGAMPNDVFNDFINDNDNIGNIEDPDGEDVDRNPVEETIIPDYDPPTVTLLDVEVDGNDAEFEIRSNEDGEYYYMILKADERPPTIREILENNDSGIFMEDVETEEFYDYFSETLDEETEYIIYAIAVDEAGNISDKESLAFKTRDGTPPVISGLTGTGLIGGTRAQITFKPSELGRYRYMIVRSDDDAPTLEEMLDQPEIALTEADVQNGVTFIYRGLSSQTQYTVYMIMTDRSGNVSAETDGEIAYSAPFWTQALDNIPPRLTKTVLDNSDITDIGREPTKVVLNFSEQLDPETAENVKNYTLGGTGNLKDSPYKATLSNDGKKVTLEIPSMAAFVNNDTLTIRIRNVEDLAGNKILDNMTNNLATYTYQASTQPILSNLIVNATDTNPNLSQMPADKALALEGKEVASNNVTFNSNYTGTYYYLIMPANPGQDVKKPLVSQVVFPQDNYEAKDVFQNNFVLAAGSGEAVVGDGAALERGNSFNIYYDPTEVQAENGYYIYMVLRDRNGNYSGVEMQYFLPNKRDWLLLNFEFDEAKNLQPMVKSETEFYYREDYMNVDDATHTFKFNMRFNIQMQKSSVESKANYILEDDVAKYLEVKDVELAPNLYDATLTLGYKPNISPADIPVANTYMAYYMKNNQKLEITMRGLKTWATSKLEEESGIIDNSANTRKIALKYIDKVKPRLLGQDPNSSTPISLAYRINENFSETGGALTQIPAQLELTFSESVQLPAAGSYGDFATLTASQGSTVSIRDIKYQKDKETGANIENKLVVTLDGNLRDLERLEITLKNDTGAGGLKDTVSNTVMINPEDASSYKAVYVYRSMPMEILYANLNGEDHTISARYQPDGSYIYESKGIVVGLKGGYQYPGMKLHYMQGTTLSGNVTATTIINATREISDLFGTKPIDNLIEVVKFDAPFDTNQVFRNDIGTFIYIVLTDSYGNISNVVKQQIMIDPNDKPGSN